MSNPERRVLSRMGARVVTEQETIRVNGGIQTETFCSIGPRGLDGDLFTGDCLAH